MSNRAWVTLATNDSYSLGALVLANSLRRAASAHPAVVLITPSVTDPMRDRLREVFAEVILVDVMDSKDAAHLALLQRPELGITFTKIHCWNLTQYDKCVFLDADTLVVQNCDELFDRSELSAAPDVGWPDCFNSGVFVFSPSADTFSKLVTFASERGSFDGGDQGLLNSYFSDWAHGDINKHLPFLYNVTSAAFYSYIPALKYYGQNLKIIHFIGAGKPWLQPYNWQSRSVDAPEHLKDFLQLWWDLFVPQVHSQLDTQMAEVEEAQLALGLEETTEYNEPVQNYGRYEPALDSSSEFPWHHPDNQIQDSEYDVPNIDIHQFHDPWNVYRGNIPPSTDETTEQKDKYQEVRQYAWDYIQPHGQHFKTDKSHNYEQDSHQNYDQAHSQNHNEHRDMWHYSESSHQPQHTHQFTHSDNSQQQDHHHIHNQESFYYHDHYQNHHNHQHFSEHRDPHHFDQGQQQHTDNVQETLTNRIHLGSHHYGNFFENTSKNITNNEPNVHNSMKNIQSTYSQFIKQNRDEQIYTVMMDHVRIHENHRRSNLHVNGYEFESDSDIDEELKPRHPYDGFYLRHTMTIDSRGRKVCIHEIPLLPQSPTPSLESSTEFEDAIDDFQDYIDFDRLNGEESQTGVAGTLARVVPGAPQQQEAVDELTRRQGWEAGNIDYMGADSFDNIWAKISQTLSQPPSSPPRQASPPKEQIPVEEAKEVQEAPVEQVESKPEESIKGTNPAEGPSESPVAAEAPVVASVPVASSEDSVSAEKTEKVAASEAVETAAPAEAVQCVPSPEATACVSIPEATECVSPPEASIIVAPIEATESVPLSEASVTVAPIVAADSVSSSDAIETVAPVEVTESVSLSEASETVAPIAAADSVSPSDATGIVAPVEAKESAINVAPIEAIEPVSSPEEIVNVAPIEAKESVSSPEAIVNVAPIEAAESVSTSEATVNVAPSEAIESVASPEANVNVAPIEATESISSQEATISVTPTEASETAASIEETVAPSEIPAPAPPVEEPVPVDIPVPANEAAESAGKPEDSIPVPVEAAVAAPVEPKVEVAPSIDVPVSAVEALKIDDACTPVPKVDPTASETPAPVPAPAPAPAVETPLEPSLNIPEANPKQFSDKPEAVSDSPPLASTPAKEEIPLAPAAKSEERRKPAGKLTLQPPASGDALPTPDSELEDAAALAHAIIAGELRTPTVTSPSPPALSSPPAQAPLPPRGLSVDQPEVPTPPVESSSAVSLSQIGVKSKPTIASQIETSVKSESAPTSPETSEPPKTPKSDAPKKKIVKKVVKKVVDKEGGASSGDAPVPVPPPRKKEKKPKEK